ncbi:MAG: 2-amino-4-hydroxy-6-hydroxymethyldihydropteridine diphosphokinase [Desulfobulbaceae bacterium]|nr:2-amino-4-hydroxy-6-hydroxymethyldihydropteridine diphosphokinase [Desulfobulbaceae bacterium]
MLQDAWAELDSEPAISTLILSHPYRTEPVGMNSDNWFINAAGVLETSLQPEALLDTLLTVEQQYGRLRKSDNVGYQDRTLDLDLLLYDDCVLKSEKLLLPHPEIHRRLFVLAPLAEIIPQQEHPVLQKGIAELFSALVKDRKQGKIKKISWAV